MSKPATAKPNPPADLPEFPLLPGKVYRGLGTCRGLEDALCVISPSRNASDEYRDFQVFFSTGDMDYMPRGFNVTKPEYLQQVLKAFEFTPTSWGEPRDHDPEGSDAWMRLPRYDPVRGDCDWPADEPA